jgi:hypothetical protein
VRTFFFRVVDCPIKIDKGGGPVRFSCFYSEQLFDNNSTILQFLIETNHLLPDG